MPVQYRVEDLVARTVKCVPLVGRRYIIHQGSRCKALSANISETSIPVAITVGREVKLLEEP